MKEKKKKTFDLVSSNEEVNSVLNNMKSNSKVYLKLITGLLDKDGGTITSDDKGEVAMVFQYSALFDSLNVFDNIT